jgi:heme-degrading monooxygenase HmoA
MILRTFRGTVRRGSEEAFYALIRERVRRFRTEHDLVDSHLARRMSDDGDRFLVTTHWPDWDALRAWAGDRIDEPWRFDELLPYLVEWEVEHYEELDHP